MCVLMYALASTQRLLPGMKGYQKNLHESRVTEVTG